MGVTIKEIAKRSGVSPSTVSLVLNDKWEEQRISSETRNRIQSVADELNYRPNQRNNSVTEKKVNSIGLIVTNHAYYYYADLVQSVESACRNAGFNFLLAINSTDSHEKKESLIRMIDMGLSGIIFDPFSSEPLSESVIDIITNSTVPIISLGSICSQLLPNSIVPDHRHGGYIAASHLLEKGHKKILCLLSFSSTDNTKDFINGYQNAFEEFGISPMKNSIHLNDCYIASYDDILTEILSSKTTAVLTNSDIIACGLGQMAQKANISVPKDLSIIGYSNFSLFENLNLPYTTISLHFDRIARKAVHLIKKIGDEKIFVTPEIIIPTLIDRGSTVIFSEQSI